MYSWRLWNIGIKWYYELQPIRVWPCRLITAVQATGWDCLTCCFKLEGMAKGTKCAATYSNHRTVWDREVSEQGVQVQASKSKQVQASWWWSIIEETTMNSLTTVGSHSVCDVCEAVEQRQSVNTGCWEQKWCTAFTIKHRFKEKKLKKKNSSSEKKSRTSRYFILSSSNMIRLQRRHLMLRLWFSQSVPRPWESVCVCVCMWRRSHYLRSIHYY